MPHILLGYFLLAAGWFLALSGCTSEEALSAAGKRQISSPRPLQDDFDARLASDGRRLWLARTGRSANGKKMFSQVFVYKAGQWKRVSPRFRATSSVALQFEIVHRPEKANVPCLGRSVKSNSIQFRCLQRGEWKVKYLSRSLRGFTFMGMDSSSGQLVALFDKWNANRTTIRVAKMRNGRIRPMGPAIRLDGQFVPKLGALTGDAPDGQIDVSIQDANSSGNRWVATLRGDRWSNTDLLRLEEEGVALSGPVRTAEALFMPVVQERMDTGNWPFSVYRWGDSRWHQVGGRPINRGLGAAQGGVDVVGESLWATWNEMIPPRQPMFGSWMPTKEWAVRFNKKGTRIVERIRLWRGRAYWPPQTQVVEYRGRPAFLYMRQSKPKGGLHTTVRVETG